MIDLLISILVEIIWGFILLVFRLIAELLDFVLFPNNAKRLAAQVTGSDKFVDVPADPKVLPPAAERALAEAEQRRALTDAS
ncbi:hypothetical protein [Bradyrhizobium iriomotense]|uniref:hypothetical protein n=1 Tax=Bradyrhizobium iriomotense TaxID=441950 RepID=UPI001B89FCF3|nr:hypothetical protein [Bradyrhizobium iriomotense]MBR1132756.1 hypothetical protein [Bradyrhizobium iriomotense]